MSVEGENHPAAKWTEAEVALARLIAKEQALPRGWISDWAAIKGVSDSSLVTAIGGQSWACITSPPPVPARQRHRSRGREGGSRPKCPNCQHVKHYAVFNGKPCKHPFHRIDHRQFTSALNLRRSL